MFFCCFYFCCFYFCPCVLLLFLLLLFLLLSLCSSVVFTSVLMFFCCFYFCPYVLLLFLLLLFLLLLFLLLSLCSSVVICCCVGLEDGGGDGALAIGVAVIGQYISRHRHLPQADVQSDGAGHQQVVVVAR